MTELVDARGRLLVTADGETIVLALQGPLDVDSGDLLLSAVASTREGGAGKVEIDLAGVTAHTEAGAEALWRCHRLAEALPCRISYRAGSVPGRAALLDALRPPR